MAADSSPILERLTAEVDPRIDQALADALPTADPATRDQVLRRLLERQTLPGLTGLVRCFHLLAAEQQELVLERAGDLAAALREAGRSDDLQERLNMIEIVRRAAEVRMAYLVADQLREADSRLTKAAASMLFQVARRLMIHTESDRADDQTRRARFHVRQAVGEALACFHQHRRRDILAAAACLAPQPHPEIEGRLADPKSPAHSAMAGLIAQADQPVICRALLSFAAQPTLREAVLRALAQGRVAEQLGFILRLAHLLPAPEVRGTLRRLNRADHLLGPGDAVEQADPFVGRKLPAWIDALPVADEAKTRVLGRLIVHPDPMTRLAGLRRLMRQDEEAGDEAIATLCFDREPTVARIALRHLLRRQWSGLNRLMVRLMSEGDPSVKQIVQQQLSPVGFDRLWVNWPQMSEQTQRTAGRALMKIDRSFHRKIARRMADRDPAARLQAVMMVRTLEQESYFEPQLLMLARDPDVRVASAAVKGLGAIGDSKTAGEVLVASLDHPDDRVRSNAIESLEGRPGSDVVVEKLLSISEGRGNRSRAAAIKALMALPLSEAVGALQRMLRDGDQRHRLSALWVVQRLSLLPLVREVGELARFDDDPRVRRRAVRVVREMATGEVAGRRDAS